MNRISSDARVYKTSGEAKVLDPLATLRKMRSMPADQMYNFFRYFTPPDGIICKYFDKLLEDKVITPITNPSTMMSMVTDIMYQLVSSAKIITWM